MKIKGLRWVIIGLIFLATVINYIDRSALAIMWGNENVEGSISQSLGLTKSDYSLIFKYIYGSLCFRTTFLRKVIR